MLVDFLSNFAKNFNLNELEKLYVMIMSCDWQGRDFRGYRHRGQRQLQYPEIRGRLRGFQKDA